MITYGFAAVISTRVSNELGARNIANARKALTVSLALSLMLGVAFLRLLGLGHDLWGVLCGVARGCGWQHLTAWTNLVAFYVIGLSLAILFGFTLAFQIKGVHRAPAPTILAPSRISPSFVVAMPCPSSRPPPRHPRLPTLSPSAPLPVHPLPLPCNPCPLTLASAAHPHRKSHPALPIPARYATPVHSSSAPITHNPSRRLS
uniref:Uncharacterized protein n=1 Tax=Zea mays TaxID=4577 RepID=A0A804PXC8_MAIZE